MTTASNENKIPVTATITASSMISMRSSARSALKLRDNRVKREQNPRHGHYNGLKDDVAMADQSRHKSMDALRGYVRDAASRSFSSFL